MSVVNRKDSTGMIEIARENPVFSTSTASSIA